jgi:hypothetical protein
MCYSNAFPEAGLNTAKTHFQIARVNEPLVILTDGARRIADARRGVRRLSDAVRTVARFRRIVALAGSGSSSVAAGRRAGGVAAPLAPVSVDVNDA